MSSRSKNRPGVPSANLMVIWGRTPSWREMLETLRQIVSESGGLSVRSESAIKSGRTTDIGEALQL